MTSREDRIEEFSEVFAEISEMGGVKETTTIFPNLIVIDDSPAALSADYIIIRDPQGYFVPAVTVPGTGFTTGDYVNALQIEGTELIAFQHGSQSSGSLKVSTVYDSDLVDPILVIDSAGDILIKSVVDSLTAVQIQNLAAGIVFNADTINDRIGLGTAAPSAKLDIDGSTDEIQFIIQADLGQTANLQEWQNSFGATKRSISSTALVETFTDVRTGSMEYDSDAASLARFIFRGDTALSVNHRFIIQVQDLVGTDDWLFLADPRGATGNFVIEVFQGNNLYFQSRSPLGTGDIIFSPNEVEAFRLFVANQGQTSRLTIGNAADIGFQIKAAAAQTGNLQEWQDSASNVLAVVNEDGDVGIGTSSPDAKTEILSTTEQLRLTHTDASKFTTFTVDTNHDLTIVPSSTGQVIFQPTTDSVDFFQVLDADGGIPVFNVDSTNERVGVGTAAPAVRFHVLDTTNMITRFEANAAAAFAGFQVQADDSAKHMDTQMFGGSFAGTQFGVARADTASVFSDGCLMTFGTKGAFDLVMGTTNAERMRIASGGLVSLNAVPLQFTEQTAPGAGAANTVKLYAVDNGAGKTQLMALFATGAAQQVAIQP